MKLFNIFFNDRPSSRRYRYRRQAWKNFLIWFPYLILICGISITAGVTDNGSAATAQSRTTQQHGSETKTSLALDPVKTLLLASTLDGSLTALGQRSGITRWITKDEPMIKVPSDGPNSSPYFLPDPRSGSLYLLGGKGKLRKLPFTIPQLVSRAPCKSSEGLLYTGKKMDFWLSLDPITGAKEEVVTLDMPSASCPAGAGENEKHSTPGFDSDGKSKPGVEKLLLGKSEYIISMVDGPKKWNVSFHDYASVDMDQETLQEYGLLHFTSPSSGALLTYEKTTGELLWETSLSSPIIALYSIDMEMKNLVSIPFTSVASETLARLKAPTTPRPSSPLLRTLYIGQCSSGLYAVSSLVDDTVLTITSSAYVYPLLEGPDSTTAKPSETIEESILDQDPLHIDTESNSAHSFVLLGHYEVPDPDSKAPLLTQISGSSEVNITIAENNITVLNPNLQEFIEAANLESKPSSSNVINDQYPSKLGSHAEAQPSTLNQFPPPIPVRVGDKDNKANAVVLAATIVLGILVTLGVGYYIGFKKFHWKRHGQPVRYLSGNNGIVSVGKINFDTTSVLGKGCEGTFVYKGKFESRDVAVKRILPECFEFADREVDLLKESDQHPNVIRYFCTETDGQFRYIALELCAATLHDWVDGKFQPVNPINPMTILKEATAGIAHLHSLRIVHRDIKPANVLLSVCPTSSSVKAMISDFGLCKKLSTGRVSFSRRSGGIPGTEGWIAPEMLGNTTNRTTHAVDVFSLGCVYYYVLTNGKHPFGSAFSRQSNILKGEAKLEEPEVETNPQGATELIKLMISVDTSERPPLSAILAHPIFWSPDKVLSFFIDVSDRIEKEEEANCLVLRRLENGAAAVIRHDWRDHICDEVKNDLRKYRTYKSHSVRDLLRALRNKKNHYRELTIEAQKSLGHIPDQFVAYWINRFPNLLPYTWRTFELIKEEPVFKKYYMDNYSWNNPNGDDELSEETDSAVDTDWRSSPDADTDWRNSPMPDGMRQRQNNKPDKGFWSPKQKSQYQYRRWKRPNNANSNNQSSSAYQNQSSNVPQNMSTSKQPAFRPPPGLEHITRHPPPNFDFDFQS